jgi:hypothetical protein
MVGNPADPTVAPGGSVAAAAWVAGAGLLVEGVALEDELLEDDESDDDELDDDELLDDAPPVDPLAGVVGAAVGPWPLPPAEILTERKSMRASCAAAWSW